MKKILLLSMAIILINSITQATIRRIQYSGTPVTGVDYASGDLAVAASSAGDTIMVFLTVTEGVTIDKKLVIIGSGSFNWSGLDANFNPNLQNFQAAADVFFSIIFAPGSDGTIVTGCILAITTTGNVSINNIKITNCTTTSGYPWNLGNGSNSNYDNWEFSKCYITRYINNASSGSLTNLKLFNCIFDTYTVNLTSNTGQTGVIENCVFYYVNLDLTLNSFIFQNCIFYGSSIHDYSNSVFNNNIFNNTYSVLGTGNIFNATNTNFFTGIPTLGTNSTDGKFKLAAGSPAIGKGINGIDCGAFGGTNPYKLSLVPAVPAIYKLTSPTTAAATNPYQITFSVRANN